MFNKTRKQIAKSCGLSIRTIERRIQDGTLKYGKHYTDYRGDDGIYQILRFNLEACQELFKKLPQKR